MNLKPTLKRANPGADLEDAREGMLVGRNGAVEHEEEESKGFLGGAVAGVSADEDVVGLCIGTGGYAEDLEGVIEAAGEEEGRALEEVLDGGGKAGGARLDEVCVDLVQITEGFALLQDKGLGVAGRGERQRRRFGGCDGGSDRHHRSLHGQYSMTLVIYTKGPFL